MQNQQLRALSIFVIACACAASSGQPRDAADSTSQRQAPMPAAVNLSTSAGNVPGAIAPDRDAAAIASLRGQGPRALVVLLAEYDRMAKGGPRDALAATIDHVAAQRYATESRLFWYTDMDEARAAAASSGKPILSLRMLGRLDEDLSCANSRFFRTLLYPDPSVASLLRERFVLHWSSERPVPRVTIDFGDGRQLLRTVTGNSVHYVLDDTGKVIDALPGMYAPSVFAGELARSLQLHQNLAASSPSAAAQVLREFHAGRIAAMDARWASLGGALVFDVDADRVLLGDAATAALSRAQRAAMSKMRVEVPLIAKVDLGHDPTALLPDAGTWEMIGLALWGRSDLPAVSPKQLELGDATHRLARRHKPSKTPREAIGMFSTPARQLVARVLVGSATAADRILPTLERSVLADTAQNELVLRRKLSSLLATGGGPLPFEQVNTFAYDDLFATPASDPWLGLVPTDVYSGLPAEGIVVAP